MRNSQQKNRNIGFDHNADTYEKKCVYGDKQSSSKNRGPLEHCHRITSGSSVHIENVNLELKILVDKKHFVNESQF